MTDIHEGEFRNIFLEQKPLMDVRAPVEFAEGSLPGAVNRPIMNDEERAQVGAAYKQSGRAVAMELGHRLVSGEVKEARLHSWLTQIKAQPDTIIYCFRGGLRSQITQRWLKERGVERPLIVGGYKKVRQFLRNEIEQSSQNQKFLLLSGPTGSAKTHILNKAAAFFPSLDLEALAHHRGSAFGAWDIPQPSQTDFENRLAAGLIRLSTSRGPCLFEDESRMIGRCALPDSFFKKMRQSELIMVEESFEQRVENIFLDYILNTALGVQSDKAKPAAAEAVFKKYRDAVQAISRKLGGLRALEILADLQLAEERYFKDHQLELNKVWIAKLLQYYYDPLYAGSLERRQVKVIFQGRSADILDKLKDFRAGC